MADEIELANENVAMETESAVAAASREAARIPAGSPGQCYECEEPSPRLVAGLCAPCRDERR